MNQLRLRLYISHSNPLENNPGYRTSILTMLPYLRSLDFAKGGLKIMNIKLYNNICFPVTDRERADQPDKSSGSRSRRKKKRSL